MALNKAQLQTELKSILSNPDTQSNSDLVAEQLATAIDTYVKTGSVTGVDSAGDAFNANVL